MTADAGKTWMQNKDSCVGDFCAASGSNHKQEVMMMILQVKVRLELRTGFRSNGDKNEKYNAVLPLFVLKAPGTSPPHSIETSYLENPTWYRNGA